MKTDDILRKNVRDLQEQLQLEYIKNKELTDTVRKQGKIIDMLLGRTTK
tara:strand:- start:189 stop:335 length:147 start_codon:yes stop_codon:yes gene_type:complete